MSNREGRDSDSRRHRSQYDREPSPKRYRRDDRRENDKPSSRPQFDKDGDDENRKSRQRHPDPPMSLEAPSAPRSESEAGTMIKEAESKVDGQRDLARHPTDPSKAVRSRSFLQHDDRATVGQSGRSIGHRSDRDYGPGRYSREHLNDRSENYSRRRDDIHERNKKDDRVWRHDGYFEMEANPRPVKRPSFREQKIQPEPRNVGDKTGGEPVTRRTQDHSVETGRGDPRWHSSDRSYRPERSLARETDLNRGAAAHTESRFSGRERLPPRQGYRPTGGLVEKWKHDLYDEANKSPSPKNEEDRMSKIEALLAS